MNAVCSVHCEKFRWEIRWKLENSGNFRNSSILDYKHFSKKKSQNFSPSALPPSWPVLIGESTLFTMSSNVVNPRSSAAPPFEKMGLVGRQGETNPSRKRTLAWARRPISSKELGQPNRKCKFTQYQFINSKLREWTLFSVLTAHSSRKTIWTPLPIGIIIYSKNL